MRVLLTLIFLFFAFANFARADAINDLYRGARATAMGGAFTALADDEEAIFYNPAAMAGNKGYQINPITVMTEISNDVVGQAQNLSAFSNPGLGTINSLMGSDFQARGQLSSSFTMPNFGFAFLHDEQYALLTANQALPQTTYAHMETNVFQADYGFSVLNPRRKRRRRDSDSEPKDDLRFGVGFKSVWREGGYTPLSVSQLLNLSTIEVHQLLGNYQQAFGMDLGAQYIHRFTKAFSFSAGMAYTDIGGENFGVSTVQPISQNLTMGMAFSLKTPGSKVNLTYDYSNMLDNVDYRERMHFGLEAGIPVVSIYGGNSEGDWDYGVGIDFWLIKIYALTYTAELDALAGQNSERRWLLQFSMAFPM